MISETFSKESSDAFDVSVEVTEDMRVSVEKSDNESAHPPSTQIVENVQVRVLTILHSHG